MQDAPDRYLGAVLLSVNPGNFQSDDERAVRRAADDLWAEAFRKDPWNDVSARWNSQDVLACTCWFHSSGKTLRRSSVGGGFVDRRKSFLRLVEEPAAWLN
jgi:hypothetical protein